MGNEEINEIKNTAMYMINELEKAILSEQDEILIENLYNQAKSYINANKDSLIENTECLGFKKTEDDYSTLIDYLEIIKKDLVIEKNVIKMINEFKNAVFSNQDEDSVENLYNQIKKYIETNMDEHHAEIYIRKLDKRYHNYDGTSDYENSSNNIENEPTFDAFEEMFNYYSDLYYKNEKNDNQDTKKNRGGK